MSSYTPQEDLSLERSRLIGMVLGGVSYGVFLLLTVQAMTILMQRPRNGKKIADHRRALLCYIFITFVLGSINFACNAKYTEMIWIDLRGAPGGPVALIRNVMNYRINVLAISCCYLMKLIMEALLLYRCLIIWDRDRRVMILMVIIYIAMIVAAILLLIQAGTGVIFYNINPSLAYLSLQVVFTVGYTILVASRLLAIRGKMKQAIAGYDSSTYDTIILMVVESAMSYTVVVIIFIVGFALHSDSISTLCFLSLNEFQGISQLFIIIRVAQGRAVTQQWSNRVTTAPTALALARTVPDAPEGTNVARVARLEQGSVKLYSVSAKVAEVEVCMA
ncbi:uncharacterized protein EDB91DRAFT_97234 [Suillus paluster]|uniref:uncharacterized protein n=1 Tax=Suillus paluster TaxID=48578 RepID=UPI001B874BE0|nr:uncharacterized protein EDB91DRAFT_97234 [Suillus paluster]KAG1725285.1 hypothetical protein EDB91DRAFT_97234 [Suillus paluster]